MCSREFSTNKYNISWLCFKILEAQMKADLAEKESLEAKRAQQEEESRENSKLISEQKAVRNKASLYLILVWKAKHTYCFLCLSCVLLHFLKVKQYA